MALAAGTVTVNANTGAHSGAGLALAMFEAHLASMSSSFPPTLVGPALGAAKKQLADQAVAYAGAIITHITTNAQVSVTVASGITVATTGTAAAQTGATTATGSGTGTVA